MHKYLRDSWRKPTAEIKAARQKRMVSWRKEGTIVRIERPTRPDRARALGYKAKPGFAIVRVRIKSGMRKRPKPQGGRGPKKTGRFFTLNISKQSIAEQKAATKYPNMEVLNSYFAGGDSVHKWFECILVDPSHPAIKSDSEINWICSEKHRARAFRGLTSAGKKSRGLRRKGIGAEKAR